MRNPVSPFRRLSIILVAVVVALPAAAGVIVLTDVAGDVSMNVAGNPVPVSGFGETDLLSVELRERVDFLDFTWTLADLEAPSESRGDGYRYTTTFYADGQQYVLEARWQNPGFANQMRAQLLRIVDGNAEVVDGILPIDVILDSDSIIVPVPTDLLTGADGKPLQLGSKIYDFTARAGSSTSGASPTDAGVETGPYDVAVESPVPSLDLMLRPSQGGTVQLSSDNSIQWSNGGHAFLEFSFQVSSTAAETITLEIPANAIPAGWNAAVIPSTIDFASQPKATGHVIVAVPGGHHHGQTAALHLNAKGADGKLATLPLGVHYPTIPQPTGHHNQMWFHSTRDQATGASTLYFNAAEEDGRDSGVPASHTELLTGIDLGGGIDSGTASWFIDLWPDLQIPLKTTADLRGELAWTISSPLPLDNFQLQGDLVVGQGSTERKIADVGPNAMTPIPANSLTQITAPVVALPELSETPIGEAADRFRLKLYVEATTKPDSPLAHELQWKVQPGATMTLPLLDAGATAPTHADSEGRTLIWPANELPATGEKVHLTSSDETAPQNSVAVSLGNWCKTTPTKTGIIVQITKEPVWYDGRATCFVAVEWISGDTAAGAVQFVPISEHLTDPAQDVQSKRSPSSLGLSILSPLIAWLIVRKGSARPRLL